MSKFEGKPAVKFEEGKIVIEMATKYDGNEDGQASVESEHKIKLDAAELVQEIAKKDLPWLNGILAGLAPKA